MMPASKSAKLERVERRRKVAQLHLQRMTQAEIASRLGVKQSTICRDLRRIDREWRESAVSDYASSRQFHFRKLDLIERELWEAWERSKQGRRSAQITKNKENETTRSGIVYEPGNPRYLDLIHKMTALRLAVSGGPSRNTGSNSPGEEVSLTERRDRIIAVAMALRDRSLKAQEREAHSRNEPDLLHDRNELGMADENPARSSTEPGSTESRVDSSPPFPNRF